MRIRGLILALAVCASGAGAQDKPAAACKAVFYVERTNDIGQHLDAEMRRQGYAVSEKVEEARYVLRVVADSKATSMTPGGTVIVVDRMDSKTVWEKRRKNWWWRSSPKKTAGKLVESLASEFKCAAAVT